MAGLRFRVDYAKLRADNTGIPAKSLIGKSCTPSLPNKFSVGCVSELKVGIETNHRSLEARLNVQPHGFRRHIGIAITKSIHKIFVGMIELFQLAPALDAEPR